MSRLKTESAVTARDVAAWIAEFRGLPIDRLMSESRSSTVCAARHAAMWVAYYHLGLSHAEIGRQMGRDRSSVSHAVRDLAKRCRHRTSHQSMVGGFHAGELDELLRKLSVSGCKTGGAG